MTRSPRSRIRIQLRGYDPRVLDRTVREIVELCKRTGARICGPIPLPTKSSLFTVLTSSHVDKKAREQFHMHEHARSLIIMDSTASTVEGLKGLSVAAGVDIKIRA